MALCACQKNQKDEPPSQVLYQVGNKTVTLNSFQLSLQDTSDKPFSFARLKIRLREKISREIRLLEAEKLAITVGKEEVDREIDRYLIQEGHSQATSVLDSKEKITAAWRHYIAENLLIQKLEERIMGERIHIDEKMAHTWYKQHLDTFQQPELVKVRQILVADKQEANKLLQKLYKGADFPHLAKDFSLAPEAEFGGDLGFLARGVLPEEFDEVIFYLIPGHVSPLVVSEYGVHIFLVDERRPAHKAPFVDVREQIMEELYIEQREKIWQQWMEELSTQTTITINWDLLTRLL